MNPSHTHDVNQLWESHHQLVFKILSNFRKKTGGWENQEMRQDAALYFTEAVSLWQPDKAKLSTWLWAHISMRLRDHYFRQRRRKEVFERGHNLLSTIQPERFRPEQFAQELSEDSREVVHTVTSHSPDLRWITIQRGKKTTPGSIRKALRIHLTQIGWKKRRIEKSFQEIREALS